MAFSDLPWKQRFTAMGDQAESAYLEVLPLGKTERHGWRRPAVSMRRMSVEMRHKPDFYAEEGWLVEVVGMGGDDVLKFKKEKMDALAFWNRMQRLVVFVYSSSRNEWLLIPYEGLRRLARKVEREEGLSYFADGKQYLPLPWMDLVGVKGGSRGEVRGSTA